MNRNILFAFLSFWVSVTAVAQTQNLFSVISIEDGMPHSEVNAIESDSTGYLWFGTYNGLARWNGSSIFVVNKSDVGNRYKSLRVLSLFHDENTGLLLIGTEDDGMKAMDLSTYSINQEFTFANTVYSIKRAADGLIWIGTERGIVKCSLSEGKYNFRYHEPALSKVSDIMPIDRNNLLAASDSGVYLIDITTSSSQRILSSFSRSILRIDGEHFLLGCSEGLFRWSVERPDKPEKIESSDVSAIYMAKDGYFWIGHIDAGISRYNSSFTSRTDYRIETGDDGCGLPDNGIHCFGEDFSGNIWIGTQNGVCKYNAATENFEFYNKLLDSVNESENIISNKTSSFYEDEWGRLWIGPYHSGLKILYRKEQKINNSSSSILSRSTISSFYRDSDRNLWIGTWEGLYIIPAKYVKAVDSSDEIPLINMGIKFGLQHKTFFKIIDDSRGNLWFSTNNGLYCHTPSGNFDGSLTQLLASTTTTDIYIEDRDENSSVLWVGTQRGLLKMIVEYEGNIPRKKSTYTVEESSPLHSEFVSAIHCDKKDRLWIFGIDGYINQVIDGRLSDSPARFRTLDINENGFADTSESVQEDKDGNLWIGGTKMFMFNPEEWSIKYYDSSNGMQNRSFKIWSSYKLSTGELVFGGSNGCSIFSPSSIRKVEDEPKIVLEDLFISGKRVAVSSPFDGEVILEKNLNLTKKLVLPYDCNNIGISFTSLHYSAPDKNSVKYILEGHDRIWTENKGGDVLASYSNLSPGTYRFRLRGSNCDNVWSDEEKILPITIRPPFWASIAAYLIYIAVAAVAFYLLGRYMKQSEQHRKEAQMNEIKLKYFADISHEIKTPLSLIAAPISEIARMSSIDGPAIQKKISLARKNLARLMDLVEQIIDFNRYESRIMKLNLSKQNIVSVCKVCMSYFEDKADTKDIDFRFESESNCIEAIIDKEKIEKVLFNIVGNAFKFTPMGGRITVSIHQNPDDVLISISDTGQGIRPEDISKVFTRFYVGENSPTGSGIGLALAKAIVEQHKGSIRVESSYNRGTCFSFRILLGDKHFSREELSSLGEWESGTYSSLQESLLAEGDSNLNFETQMDSVLVVEDNEDMRNYLTDVLCRQYHVSTATNGKEACKKAEKHEYSCIISDVMMPVMDGFQLCHAIKNNIQTSHIPVLLLTAKDAVEDKITGLNICADDYIQKPFDVALLIARIENLIKRYSEQRTAFNKEINYSPSMVTITPIDEQFMNSCMSLIEKNISDSSYNVESLCSDLSMSRPTVYRKIKYLTGLSAVAFIRSIRMKRAAQLLRQDASSIKSIMYMVGFENSSYFSAQFKKEFGCTPNEYVEHITKQ